jgi:hypothetical protein
MIRANTSPNEFITSPMLTNVPLDSGFLLVVY